MTHYIKTHAIQVVIVAVVLLFAVKIFSLPATDKSNINYTDLYTKEIKIGDATLRLIVKIVTVHDDNRDWLNGEYQFYSVGEQPELLAKIVSLIPPEYSGETNIDPFLSTKDITGDEIPEIFVLVERSASNLSEYEILKWENGSLVNIILENSDSGWVDFDNIAYKDGYIELMWHGPTAAYKVGRNDHALEGNTLRLLQSFVFDFSDTPGKCVVKVKHIGEPEFAIIDRTEIKNCAPEIDAFDVYINSSPKVPNEFERSVNLTLNDLQWEPLASIFKKTCSIGGYVGTGSGFDPGSLTFKEFISYAGPVKEFPNNEAKVFIFPCTPGSYQTGYMAALYDGVTYQPLKVTLIDENGKQYESYTGTEMSYNSEKDEFFTMAKLSASGTC